ncbi:transmembrane protein 181 [Arctopsyche grandis]|uniref:transmembrane protein 181 n=1 Tax=Arctopsyche grandis TaxID=121162 RepID=UPI00406D92D3
MDTSGLGYSYHLPSNSWNLKIRSALSQFSDLFSEFNKYIAPAYHHDRCERSVQMRLYSMHKGEFVMVFIAFFACFGLGVFIGLAGPPITLTSIQRGSLLLGNQSTLPGGPYVMRSPALGTYNQQLWLITEITTDNKDEEIFDKSFQVSVSIDGLTEEHKPVSIIHPDEVRNRTRHLRCEKHVCDEFTVLHLGFLDYTHYVLGIKFYGLENFHQLYHINEVTFYFKTYNPAFTQIEIWFRFIFLLGTFFITCWFAHTLRKYMIHDWSTEQRWLSVLLPLLLLYDNPIFPMTFLVSSWLPGFLDAILQATFLSALLMFWLCMYHGLRQNERWFMTFYFPKLFIVGMIWLSAIILATWQKYNELRDPTYDYVVDTTHYYTLQVFFFTFGGLYILYLVYLILRAYTDLRNMPFFDMRLKCLTLLMLTVLGVSITVTIMRFGAGVLEDNFVAQLSTHYNSSAQFMTFYGLLNFYIYTMAYVYSPSNKPPHEVAITKDNPAFSMINDSDEDVIYGSDEESRRPLNRSHNDDDSD